MPTPAVVLPRVVGLVRSLPDHSLVDRLVRGRAWIPVLGVLLAGIVAMQVEVLKLGTSIGRAIEQSATLQGQNESLQASVASLADSQRIERLAANMGMIMPAPTAVSFLTGDGNVGAAIANIQAPDQSAFEAQLQTDASSASGDSSSESGGATGADASGSTTSATVTVPDAPAITATGAGSTSGDTGQGSVGTTPADGTTASPTDATGTGTEGTNGGADGTPTGTAATPVAGPQQTSTGAGG